MLWQVFARILEVGHVCADQGCNRVTSGGSIMDLDNRLALRIAIWHFS
jgi:hypothetical protein